jgi:hypothetical protein
MANSRPHPHSFHTAAVVAALVVLAGCSALRGPGSTPAPTLTVATDPPPTASATPRASSTGHATYISHPTGATDVVLRAEWGGGLVPMQFFVTQAPQFTLYGDGTAVFRPLPDVKGQAFNEPLPPFLTGHMSEDAIQEMLDYALHDGGLATAKTSYDYPNIADAGTTNFTITVGGVDKQVSAYALVEGASDGPDAQDRQKLMALQERLRTFETEARAGAVDEVVAFDPEFYRVVLYPEPTGTPRPGVEPFDWPWPDIKVSDFVPNTQTPGATLAMRRADVAKLTDIPNGGQASAWVTAPDGSLVSFALRPFLPGDVFPAAPID